MCEVRLVYIRLPSVYVRPTTVRENTKQDGLVKLDEAYGEIIEV